MGARLPINVGRCDSKYPYIAGVVKLLCAGCSAMWLHAVTDYKSQITQKLDQKQEIKFVYSNVIIVDRCISVLCYQHEKIALSYRYY